MMYQHPVCALWFFIWLASLSSARSMASIVSITNSIAGNEDMLSRCYVEQEYEVHTFQYGGSQHKFHEYFNRNQAGSAPKEDEEIIERRLMRAHKDRFRTRTMRFRRNAHGLTMLLNQEIIYDGKETHTLYYPRKSSLDEAWNSRSQQIYTSAERRPQGGSEPWSLIRRSIIACETGMLFQAVAGLATTPGMSMSVNPTNQSLYEIIVPLKGTPRVSNWKCNITFDMRVRCLPISVHADLYTKDFRSGSRAEMEYGVFDMKDQKVFVPTRVRAWKYWVPKDIEEIYREVRFNALRTIVLETPPADAFVPTNAPTIKFEPE